MHHVVNARIRLTAGFLEQELSATRHIDMIPQSIIYTDSHSVFCSYVDDIRKLL